MDCKACKERFRADKLIEDWGKEHGEEIMADGWTDEQFEKFIAEKLIPCPSCGKHDFTGIRKFNLMFKTHQGVNEDSSTELYLRPETAQGIFVNFKSIVRSTRRKLPMGVGQIGKSFRNEITPGNFIFRIREFEQMELEFFCKPGEDMEWFQYWRAFCRDWLLKLGMKEESLRLRDHKPEELSHYSTATTDFEFQFPFGWGELWGIADRTDFDLKAHQRVSGENMEYIDPMTNERYVPYVIEPSLGADRVALAFLCNAYEEQELEGGDSRVVLHLHPALAPYKAAVLPLQKNKLGDLATEVFDKLSKKFMAWPVSKRKTAVRNAYAIAFLIGVAAVLVCHIRFPFLLNDFGMYWYPFALITPGLCVGLAFLLQKAEKIRGLFTPLRTLGKASFEIYLLNIWMVELLKIWKVQGTFLWLVLCVFNALAGIGYHILVENWSSRLQRKTPKNAGEIQA